MNEEARRTAAINKFYDAYRELQKYDTLRLYTHESIYDDAVVEVYRYQGGKKGDRVLRVARADVAEAYELAADQVENMLKQIRQK